MPTNLSKAIKAVFLVCILYLTVYLIVFPAQCIEVCRNTINMCLNSVVPSLFPFLICSGFFSATGAATICSRRLSPFMKPLFKLPGCSAVAFILGIISGYPIGAVCAADLYSSGQCSKADAERMCAFCNNSGPVFVMSVVGCGFLGNARLGRYLYISHVLSAIVLGVLLRFYQNDSANPMQKKLPPKEIPTAKDIIAVLGTVMDTSVFNMLKICGFIVFFAVFATALPKGTFSPFLHSFFEITGGIQQISLLKLDLDLKMCIISFFIAFSGVSIFLQVGSIISKHGISLAPYIIGKLAHGCLSAAITKLLLAAFPISRNTFLEQQKSPAVFSAEPLDLFLYSILCIAIVSLGIFVLSRRRANRRR